MGPLSALFAWAAAGLAFTAGALASAEPRPLLTVEQAVELALRQHPRLSVAAYLTEANRHTIEQARAGYYPRVFFGAQWLGGSIQGNPAGHLGFPDFPGMGSSSTGQVTSGPLRNSNYIGANSSYLAGLSLSLPLHDFGRTKGRVQEAEGRTFESAAAEQTAREQILVGVRRAYYRVLGAQAIVRIEEESVARLSVHAETALAMVGGGLRTPIEVPRTKAELARAQARLIGARNAVKVARVVLDNAIGERTEGRYRLADARGEAQVAGTLEALLAMGRQHRPELVELRGRRTSTLGRLQWARGNYYPSISASASVNVRGVGGFGNGFNYDAGLVLSWRVFDGYLYRSEVLATKARLRNLEAARDELRQRIELEIRRAHADVETLAEAIPVVRAAERFARENLRLATARFRGGLSPIIELADAEALFATAQANVIRALHEYQIAAATLERAVGRRLPTGPP